jgi:glycosyltransferase involved in cell wall biosynthesis
VFLPSQGRLVVSLTYEVIVTGFVDDVRLYAARCEVLIVPLLRGDESGDRVLEAMTMGKAVICPHTRGQRDHMRDDEIVTCVLAKDRWALSKAIQYLREHPQAATRRGCEERRFISTIK